MLTCAFMSEVMHKRILKGSEANIHHVNMMDEAQIS